MALNPIPTNFPVLGDPTIPTYQEARKDGQSTDLGGNKPAGTSRLAEYRHYQKKNDTPLTDDLNAPTRGSARFASSGGASLPIPPEMIIRCGISQIESARETDLFGDYRRRWGLTPKSAF